MDPVTKFLRKADARLRKRLIELIMQIEKSDLKNLDIKPLQGQPNFFRCRAGSIRILFMRTGTGACVVYDISFRGSAYKK
jgi:mRNA-degrading endonuclease RelE of RelBE toxin-antitoxin system